MGLYTLQKYVGYYDLSVLSMDGIQKKKSLLGVGGWVSFIQILFLIFGKKINFAKPLNMKGIINNSKNVLQFVLQSPRRRVSLTMRASSMPNSPRRRTTTRIASLRRSAGVRRHSRWRRSAADRTRRSLSGVVTTTSA